MKSLLWALLLFAQIHEHSGCIEEERMGLIELKAFLKSNINYTNRLLLPSWVNEAKSECCDWERVRCDATTGHVTELCLSNVNQAIIHNDGEYGGHYYFYQKTWFLNVSLLQPFKELRILDLSGNAILGWLGKEGM